MSTTRKRWLIGIGISLTLAAVALFIAASYLSRRFEPIIREQAIQYLEQRFRCDVTLAALHIRMPKTSTLRMLWTKGRGAIASVEGEGLSMRFQGADAPPLFSIRRFGFHVDIGNLFEDEKTVPLVTVEGMEIHIPPKGQRHGMLGSKTHSHEEAESARRRVLIKEIRIQDAKLLILPKPQPAKEKKKVPLEFDIHRLQLQSVGRDVAMTYNAELTNPKPPGDIKSSGTFGPWAADEPGDTPLTGKYTFTNADLGVFHGIAGILHSTGSFEGSLSSIQARGDADVPDFRLTQAGNPVPLKTHFEALIDGTNGNTILKPVRATLGTTTFTTSGGIIKHEEGVRRAISLDVSMPKGNMRDVLRLAMKGSPFMEGYLNLKTKIDIPPLSGKVFDALLLDGRFDVTDGKFLQSKIQDQIDGLSRRGQGQPENVEIDAVIHHMKGVFRLEHNVMTFRSLSFEVPGAAIDLAGSYGLRDDELNFKGAVKLQAKVSQTQTGWKRWALKPVDPFLAKNGVGTFLRIKVEGTSKQPKFGLDLSRGKDQQKQAPAASR